MTAALALPGGPLRAGAGVCAGIALLVLVAGLLRVAANPTHAAEQLAGAVGLALEFLLAGGLLRLATTDTYVALATAAAIVVARKVISVGVGFAVRALSPGSVPPGRLPP